MLAPATESLLHDASNLLITALEILDRAGAPGDIGAHVDHARERIAETLKQSSAMQPTLVPSD